MYNLFSTNVFLVIIPVTSPCPILLASGPIVNSKVAMSKLPLNRVGFASGKSKVPFTVIFPLAVTPGSDDDIKLL